MRADAYLSEDRKYRYWLLRQWDESLPILALIGANPSKADEAVDRIAVLIEDDDNE